MMDDLPIAGAPDLNEHSSYHKRLSVFCEALLSSIVELGPDPVRPERN
jgi:hypothetical protein